MSTKFHLDRAKNSNFTEFLPRDAMLASYMLTSCICPLSECLTVRPSVTRRYCNKTLKVGSRKRFAMAQGRQFSDAKDPGILALKYQMKLTTAIQSGDGSRT